MRERTTWNRDQIKQAAQNKVADPYTMNQDHVDQQPKADAYVTGTPSDFAEDVNKENRWETEYSGGEVKRDEIGMPEKRPETYNHPEKTASEAVLLKKADLTVKVARMMLPKTATEAAIEDQAFGLMYMPDAELINTFDRLANESEFPGGQFPTAQQQAPVQQEQQAQQQAPVQQQAQQQQTQPVAMDQQAQLQSMIQSMVEQAMKQQGCGKMANGLEQQQQAQQQVQQAQQQQVQQAQQQQAQQQAQQEQQAQQQEQQAQQQQPVSDDQLLDTMLMGPEGDIDMGMGIEMEAPTMDTGDVVLGPEDDVLRTLFANQEAQDAEQVQQQQEGGEQKQEKQAGMTRTASTRTVGTRPTQGVSRVGGAAASSQTSSSETNKLAALWPSAPDVREAFGINK